MNLKNNVKGEGGPTVALTRPAVRPVFRRTSDVVIVLGVVIICVQTYYCFGDISYYLENGLFETCQNLFLFLAAVLYFQAARTAPDVVSRSFWLAMTIFCMCVLFREMDVRGTRLEPLLGPVFNRHLHYGFLGVLWIALLIGSWGHVWRTILLTPRWSLTSGGLVFLAGCVLYVMGDIAEKHFMTGDPDVSEMLEETFEQLGTMFLCLSAYVSLRFRSR
ncbi:MAG: hypothetical protein ACOH12_01885 [Parvibaculaceae bacterium]